MDSERFDRLARSFGQTRTRRQTLRGLAGAVAVGAFAAGRREVGAKCTASRKGCKTDGQCCAGLKCQTNSGKGPAKTCQTALTPGTCQTIAVEGQPWPGCVCQTASGSCPGCNSEFQGCTFPGRECVCNFG